MICAVFRKYPINYSALVGDAKYSIAYYIYYVRRIISLVYYMHRYPPVRDEIDNRIWYTFARERDREEAAARRGWKIYIYICMGDWYTHSYDCVELGHGDLLRPVDGRRHLLLMLLREKRQNLRDDGVQPLRYFRLQSEKRQISPELALPRDRDTYIHCRYITYVRVYIIYVCVWTMGTVIGGTTVELISVFARTELFRKLLRLFRYSTLLLFFMNIKTRKIG